MRPLYADLQTGARALPRGGAPRLLSDPRPGDILVDGIALRRGRDRRLLLRFPKRRDPRGEVHLIVRPATPAARAAFEDAVIRELRARRESA